MVGVGSSQVASHHKYPTEAWHVGSICRLLILSSGFVWDFQLMIHDRNEEDIFPSPIEKRTSFQWPHRLLCLWHCAWGRSQLSQVVRLERAAKVHLQWSLSSEPVFAFCGIWKVPYSLLLTVVLIQWKGTIIFDRVLNGFWYNRAINLAGSLVGLIAHPCTLK